VGSGFFLVLLVMFGLLWVVMIRPQRQQQRKQTQMLAALKVGDEVVTAGGIYGEVKSLDVDRVRLEVDADVEIVVARRAIASVVPPDEEHSLDDSLAAHDAELEQAEDELRTPDEEPAEEDRAAR
jgi:preprotein translocase subunit YajC